ncbi:uncharacterized protein LOC116208916 [Punica granatum]|uniref:Uncharacterized protein LOC116208916 n=1 Tax=Punica granatum TaxID=22663 RepID=A0A6P8DVB6_PUNGR|nr:uncharacterized protein LOC116208916 [Punica granatum]
MAFSSKSSMLLLFFSALCLHSAMAGGITCEEIPTDMCAFAVASLGKRCALETAVGQEGGGVEYQCMTSEVVVENVSVVGYVESDRCVAACGVDRRSVGISSDAMLEPPFIARLCSPDCYDNCPNIVDLYFNLAAGEGAYLPDFCNSHRENPHRTMIELSSSGAALAPAPAPAPM